MKIDLHTHSLHSDGSDTPTELVERAAAAGLDVVALTDHDTTAGWDEAVRAGEKFKIHVVLGVEFSVTNEGRGQHLLGYGFDPTHSGMAEIFSKGATSRQDRADALLARLMKEKPGVDAAEVKNQAGGILSRKHVAAALVAAKYFESDDEAFAKYLNPGLPGYVERWRPDIEVTIKVIRAAGGVSVIAHPRDTKRGPGISDGRFAALKEAGLNGIEVDHQAHSSETREELRKIADKHGLVATGSSDYHGTRKIDHDLGCNLTHVDSARHLLGTRAKF